MGDISTGFQTSQNEIIIFLILLGIIVVGLLVAQIFRRRAVAKMARQRAKNPKNPILRSYSRPQRNRPQLSGRDQRTLDHLAWFLRDPRQSEKLLDDDTQLLRTARFAVREGIVPEADVMRLLRRLDVDVSPLRKQDQKTTEELPAGAEVSLSTPAMAMGTGELLLNDAEGVQVRIDKGTSRFKPGDPVDAVCNSSDGMFQFHTTILSIKGKKFVLRHTPHVRHAQRRRYRRREIAMPVQVSLPGMDQRPFSSTTEDLSIGGMALRNPRKRLIVGAYIEASIDLTRAAPLVVSGTVVRLSRRRKTAHISFSSLDEKTRHRLLRRLIRAG